MAPTRRSRDEPHDQQDDEVPDGCVGRGRLGGPRRRCIRRPAGCRGKRGTSARRPRVRIYARPTRGTPAEWRRAPRPVPHPPVTRQAPTGATSASWAASRWACRRSADWSSSRETGVGPTSLAPPSFRAEPARLTALRSHRERRSEKSGAPLSDSVMVARGLIAPVRKIEFGLLGPLEVSTEGGPISLGPPQQRALLALLLLNANEVMSSDRIVDELWGEEPPASVAKLVQVHVSALRKLLEPERDRREPNRVLITRPPGYLLEIEPDQLDLTRFEHLHVEARRALAQGDVPAARAQTGRGVVAVARAAARGLRLCALRPGGDRPPRGTALDRARGADRGRPRARRSQRPDRRARGTRQRASPAGAAPRAADARALPLRAGRPMRSRSTRQRAGR